jgi:HlyD family secretion protein
LLEGKPKSYSPFRPGMTATVDIITKRKEKVIGVPISAVVVKSDTASGKKPDDKMPKDAKVKAKSDKKFECVFVRSNGKAKLRVIKTGIQDDTNIEVREGLKKGDEVIVGPYTTVTKDLNPGDLVTEGSGSGKKDEKKEGKTSVTID